MFLTVTRYNGQEETYEVPDTTTLRRALRDETWFFRCLSGGEIAIQHADALDLKLGNVSLLEGTQP